MVLALDGLGGTLSRTSTRSFRSKAYCSTFVVGLGSTSNELSRASNHHQQQHIEAAGPSSSSSEVKLQEVGSNSTSTDTQSENMTLELDDQPLALLFPPQMGTDWLQEVGEESAGEM
ncbi:hypothetical protein E4U55_000749 [Claviceps digitariae]|nr:hypothetical protein E4U55_000749 [Claviceps digitariae]